VIMRTTIVASSDSIDDEAATAARIEEMIERTSRYAPGYKASIGLKKVGQRAICQVIVSGCGDYLPNYAGNLDIINCAALELIKSL
jgi:acetaldehyde dehydrogenase (acetylating)